ncbi:MAG: hypothetical protein A2W76_11230 [Gammaproteobacteria bacterium RIFCSPLOWO2_12_47_11]|nr:MAG: hypothetical protein A2W76_11230 [Gammaproteobacteria bacterium RIFCSPLOWO2_12_47_11]
MRRSGYNLHIVLLAVFVLTTSTTCAALDSNSCREYSEKDMGQLATFVRVTMDIVSSTYMGEPAPALVTEENIKELIKQRGTPFKELELLDQYELNMVTHEGQWATVVWDSANNQKLLQDLRCTKLLDEPSWRTCAHGHELTLDWSTCN